MQALPEGVKQLLAAVAARRRRFRLLAAVCDALLLLVVAMVAVAIIDYAAQPASGTRFWLSVLAYGGAAGWLLVAGVLPALRRRDDLATARFIESAAGTDLDERLSAAVEMSRRPPQGVSGWMVERTVALAAHDAQHLQPARLVPASQLRRPWMRGGGGALLLLVTLLLPGAGSLMSRALWPGAAAARPAMTSLDLQPAGDVVLQRGADFTVAVQADPVPSDAELEVRWEDGLVEVLPLKEGEAGRFVRRLRGLTQGLQWRVRAADAESALQSVSLREPPRLEEIQVRVEPQAYTGLPARVVPGGDAEVLAGSTCVIEARLAGQDVDAATVVIDGQEPRAVPVEDGWVRFPLVPERDLRYGLAVDGSDADEVERRWSISVVRDRRPQVQIDGEHVTSGFISADEVLTWQLQASDDIGLQALFDLWQVDTREPQRRPVPMGEGSAQQEARATQADAVTLTRTLPLADTLIEKGQRLTISALAVDQGGQQGRSEPLRLLVVDPVDAANARLARRLRALREQFSKERDAFDKVADQWVQVRLQHRAGDPGAQAGRLRLISQGQNHLASRFHAIADGMHAAAVENAGPYAPHLMTLGERLHARVDGWLGSLQTLAMRLRQADTGSAALLDGSDARVTAARDGLATVDRWLARVIATLDAEGLVLTGRAHHQRLQRTLPVVRGYRGWMSEGAAPGLIARFYDNPTLNGTVAHRAVMLPQLQNFRAPGAGKSNWSVRFSGEIRIPADGRWRFELRSDDGVRLAVAGEELIGGKAWKDQPPTAYTGSIDLQAGWHPISIRHYQGGGGQALQLHFGPADGELRAITLADTRNFGSDDAEVDRRLVREMSRLDPAIGRQAARRLRSDGAALVGIADTVQDIARLAADDDLDRVEREARTHAAALDTLIGGEGDRDWSLAQLDAIGEQAQPMVAVSEELRSRLRRLLRELQPQRAEGTGRIARLRDRTRTAERAADDLQDAFQDDDFGAEEQVERLQERLAILADDLVAQQQAYRDQAADPGRSLGERDRALAAAARMQEDVLPEMAAAQERLAEALAAQRDGNENQARQQAGRSERALDELDEELEDLQQADERLQRAAEARLAEHALTALDRHQAATRRGAVLRSTAAERDLEQAVQELARAQRQRGAFSAAEELQQVAHAADSQADADTERLREHLQDLAKPAYERSIGNRQRPPEHMPDLVTDLAAAQEAGDSAAVVVAEQNLAAAGVELGLAAEWRRERGDETHARALEDLAQRTRAALDAEQGPDLDALDTVAGDARILADGKHRARQDLLAAYDDAGNEEQPADDTQSGEDAADSDDLDALARRADDARHDEDSRAQLQEDLRALAAADTPDASEQAAVLEQLAQQAEQRQQRIADLQQQLAQVDAEADREREAFAERSAATAQRLQELAEEATAAEDGSMRQAVVAFREQAAAQQAALEALQERTDAEASHDAATDEALAADAARSAEALQQELATPLAQAYRASAGRDPSPAVEQAADIGRHTGELAHAQEEAAGALTGALERRHRLRHRLAEAVAAAARDQQRLTAALDETGGETKTADDAADGEATAAADTDAGSVQEPLAAGLDAQRQADAAMADLTEAQADLTQAQVRLARHRAEDDRRQTRTWQERVDERQQRVQDSAQAAAAAQEDAVAALESAATAAQDAGPTARQRALDALDAARSNARTGRATTAGETQASFARSAERASAAAEGLLTAQSDLAEPVASNLGEAAAAARAAAQAAAASTVTGEPVAAQSPPGEAAAAATTQPAGAEGQASSTAATNASAPASPIAAAAQRALDAIDAAPSDREAYQRASRMLAQAASEQRLASAAAPASAQAAEAALGAPSSASSAMATAGTSGEGSASGDPGGELGALLASDGAGGEGDWAHLPERVREAIRRGSVDTFDAEHQQAIQAYFQRLAEEE